MRLEASVVLHTCACAVEILNEHSLEMLLSFVAEFQCLQIYPQGNVHDVLPMKTTGMESNNYFQGAPQPKLMFLPCECLLLKGMQWFE